MQVQNPPQSLSKRPSSNPLGLPPQEAKQYENLTLFETRYNPSRTRAPEEFTIRPDSDDEAARKKARYEPLPGRRRQNRIPEAHRYALPFQYRSNASISPETIPIEQVRRAWESTMRFAAPPPPPPPLSPVQNLLRTMAPRTYQNIESLPFRSNQPYQYTQPSGSIDRSTTPPPFHSVHNNPLGLVDTNPYVSDSDEDDDNPARRSIRQASLAANFVASPAQLSFLRGRRAPSPRALGVGPFIGGLGGAGRSERRERELDEAGLRMVYQYDRYGVPAMAGRERTWLENRGITWSMAQARLSRWQAMENERLRQEWIAESGRIRRRRREVVEAERRRRDEAEAERRRRDVFESERRRRDVVQTERRRRDQERTSNVFIIGDERDSEAEVSERGGRERERERYWRMMDRELESRRTDRFQTEDPRRRQTELYDHVHNLVREEELNNPNPPRRHIGCSRPRFSPADLSSGGDRSLSRSCVCGISKSYLGRSSNTLTTKKLSSNGCTAVTTFTRVVYMASAQARPLVSSSCPPHRLCSLSQAGSYQPRSFWASQRSAWSPQSLCPPSRTQGFPPGYSIVWMPSNSSSYQSPQGHSQTQSYSNQQRHQNHDNCPSSSPPSAHPTNPQRHWQAYEPTCPKHQGSLPRSHGGYSNGHSHWRSSPSETPGFIVPDTPIGNSSNLGGSSYALSEDRLGPKRAMIRGYENNGPENPFRWWR